MLHPEADLRSATTMPATFTETAYAKVNLALHVRARRDDGYHALESLFVFAQDGDTLTGVAQDDPALTLRIDGPFGAMLDAGEDNLVMKAARALQSHTGARRGAALRLTKHLPVASGIGGGSADAAAALRLLVRLWDISIENADLAMIALALGSDVPACVASVTQLVRGRGEVLDRHDVAGLAGMPMLLLNPGVAVSTAAVFAGWDRIDRGALVADGLGDIIRDGRNDLEAPARAAAPAIDAVLAALAAQAPMLSRMSGSGATCFALFEDDAALVRAAAAIRRDNPGWWVMETRIRTA